MYLQHGGGEDERAWPIQGRVAQIMDNLIAAGQAKPMLIVMERGYALKPGEVPVPFGPGATIADPAAYYDGVFADVAAFNARTKLLFLGHGGAEPERMMTGFHGFHARLTELGIQHDYYVSEGTGHVWLTERRNLREFATRLFR